MPAICCIWVLCDLGQTHSRSSGGAHFLSPCMVDLTDGRWRSVLRTHGAPVTRVDSELQKQDWSCRKSFSNNEVHSRVCGEFNRDLFFHCTRVWLQICLKMHIFNYSIPRGLLSFWELKGHLCLRDSYRDWSLGKCTIKNTQRATEIKPTGKPVHSVSNT